MKGDILGIGDSHTVFSVGFYKVNLIHFLECLLRCLVEIIATTDKDHGPRINPSIENSTYCIGVTRAWHAQANTRDTSKESSVARTVGCLLLISEPIVINACPLDCIAKLYHWYSYFI